MEEEEEEEEQEEEEEEKGEELMVVAFPSHCKTQLLSSFQPKPLIKTRLYPI